MTQLALLRSRLQRLRRTRAVVRMATAWSSLLIALLWVLTAVFFIDWLLEMDRPQRFVALLICAGVITWAFRRYTLPWLGRKEDELDMALFVERQQHIDSDLVAALQFEQPESAQWGSTQLESAVINYVDEFTPDLDVFEGLSMKTMTRRIAIAAGTIAMIAILVLAFPQHAAAFLDRMLLGSAHYPTRTAIESIHINDQPVFPVSSSSETLRSPYGRPLAFRVVCTGEIPNEGLLRLRSLQNQITTELKLLPEGVAAASVEDTSTGQTGRDQTPPASTPATENRPADGNAAFVATLPRLVDSLTWQVYLGDAWTEPRQVEVIELPVIIPDVKPVPPEYAARAEQESAAEREQGLLQVSVIEGSRVDLSVECRNKDLRSVTLSLGEQSVPLEQIQGNPRKWSLQGDGHPFASISQPMRYEIQVVDVDGLSLEKPRQGYIRIRADRAPRVIAAISSKRYVAEAVPVIEYGAADDYGLAALRLHLHVVRQGAGMEETIQEIVMVDPAEQPRKILRGHYPLPLKSLKLEVGDELKLTLEATDYRGGREPQSSLSEALVVEITDVKGIMSTLLEADEKSASQLDAIILRELGIGDSK